MNEKVRVILASVIAVVMLLFSYWVTNQRYAVSGETGLFYKLELIRGWFAPPGNQMTDSVLLVDVAYDKVAVGVNDEQGVPAGYGQITDRQKLTQLLTELKRRNDYKYILLDVLFADDIHTDADSALFSLIESMDRIVIPSDLNCQLADERLYKKAGLANYFTNYKYVSLAKYPYMVDGQKSLPLMMYEEMTGRHISSHNFFSTDGWRLARESIVLTFELRCTNPYSDNGEKTWYNLGMDLLGSSFAYSCDTIKGNRELYDNPELTKDKYIVVGALSNDDIHYSYLGNQPGSTILFNAYLALLHGHHWISWGVALLLFVAFFILGYLIVGGQTMDAFIMLKITGKSRWSKAGQRMLSVIVSWVGYSMFLTILCIITYMWMGEVYDIFITATVFQLLNIISNYIYKLKKKYHHA